LSASRGSLLDKTKGQLKKLRNAVSLERGLDSAGVDTYAEPREATKTVQSKGSKSVFTRMKKAPSLKSITSLFKKNKKKGKTTLEDPEQNMM